MNYTIDVSRYDAYNNSGNLIPIDWKATGFPLAIMKSSEGTFADTAFKMQWKAAQGMPRMAYHFFRSNVNAIAQAQFMTSLLKPDFTENDFIAIDFETWDGMTATQCLAGCFSFLYEMQKIGTTPFIYTFPAFWNALGGSKQAAAIKYPLWLGQWPWDNYFLNIKVPPYTWTAVQMVQKKALIESGVVKPMPLAPWTKPAIWQWTARADPKQIPGYYANKSAVDYNVIFDVDLPTPTHPTVCPTCGQAWT
jgi:GH25 family lysozyme M1 (1,4-beta-N-acetylmuramidase)